MAEEIPVAMGEEPTYEISLLAFQDSPGFAYLVVPAPDGTQRYWGVSVTSTGFLVPFQGFLCFQTEEEALDYQKGLVETANKEKNKLIVPRIAPLETLPKDVRKIIDMRKRVD